jgi:hypothetical protein
MYDNRENKKNPKAPDFKCKDQACVDEKGYVTAVWEKKEGERPAGKPRGKSEDERLEIIRQSSLKVACEWLTGKEATKEQLTMLSEYLTNYVRFGLGNKPEPKPEPKPQVVTGNSEDDINLEEFPF